MRHLTLTLSLILGLGTSVSAEIIMICDALENQKRYYKLTKSFSGNNTVEQKKNGQWVDWFDTTDDDEFFFVKGEVYDSGALLVTGSFKKWAIDYPEEEVVAGKEYYIEDTYILDFEFGLRKTAANVFTDKTKTKELKKHAFYEYYANDFACQIQK